MKTLELIERINNGEDSFTQFKREAISAKDLAKEFVAFLNAAGGVIVFGVEDNGRIQGLSTAQIEELGQLIGNTANENVKPPFYPLVENRSINERKLVIAYVPKGSVKPYSTSGGEYLTKSGADKKKLSQEELRRLFAESKRLYADEESVYGTDITDLDTALFYKFLEKDNVAVFDAVKLGNLALAQVLENLDLLNNKQLTLAGNLIFGIRPQKFNKSFYIDCCYFDGNDVAVDRFISKRVVDGNLLTMFNNSLDFFKSNLKNLQTSENFNSYATLEIDERILIELIVNALVHRDYYIQSSIKLFIFQNRVEIISPGKLTNSLTVEKIKSGISIHRNPILNSICKTILPYSGYGSGIRRALLINEDISFYNDTDKEQFICTIPREVSN
ncbi:MAG: putative DNA binding domain-containing protein [Burkholderiales bacterium]|jgi:predicted HTH transcriptional regulator|nr:putative DNA binding domain-containing protein [Burkholderiales bacterium]MBP9769336.1 putative DNA binding domain-containing protein [Burkholderiales bacterium]